MDRIGILGGTFHPFHNGHLLLGKYCLKHVGLDEIWYIPTGYSYFKEGQVMLSGEDRLHLLSLGIQGEQRMKVLDIEIQDKLDLIYQYMGEAGKEMGQRLSELARGKSKSEQDKAEIYDLFGRISDAYRQIQRGEIEQADEQRNSDLNAFYRHFKED